MMLVFRTSLSSTMWRMSIKYRKCCVSIRIIYFRFLMKFVRREGALQEKINKITYVELKEKARRAGCKLSHVVMEDKRDRKMKFSTAPSESPSLRSKHCIYIFKMLSNPYYSCCGIRDQSSGTCRWSRKRSFWYRIQEWSSFN